MKTKRYDIFIVGSVKTDTIYASCISKAAKQFIETLEKEAKYTLCGKQYASIRFNDNYSICSDYVIIEV